MKLLKYNPFEKKNVYYDWVCDRCRHIIFNERIYDFQEMVQRIDDNKLVIQRARSGKLIHFCNQICKDKHRGEIFRENLYRTKSG